MRIQDLRLTNFRCFEDLHLQDLDPHLNVIVGVNGSGKSSVLQGINVALSRILPNWNETSRFLIQRHIKEEDVRLKTIYEDIVYQFPVEVNANLVTVNGFRLHSHTIDRGNNSSYEELGNIINFANYIYENSKLEDDDTLFPLLCYYSTQRLFSDENSNQELAKIGRLLGYYRVFDEMMPKQTLYGFLIDQQIQQTANREILNDGNYFSPFIKLLNENMVYAFSEFKLVRMHFRKFRNFPDRDDVYLIYENGNELPLKNHSDGQRNLFWLVFDLTYRCYILNPFLGTEACQKAVGVVTIDEVDLHLHPRMQSTVIPTLRKLFPGLQFFITTHSPLVLSSVRGKNIIVLEDFQVKPVMGDTYGKSVHDLLGIIFEAPIRQNEVDEKLKRYYYLIENNKADTAEAINLRKNLETLIGKDDVELNNANLLIEMLRLGSEKGGEV